MPSLNLHTSVPLHTDRIWQLTAHPTLPLLASASSDRTARLFSLSTYAPHSTLEGGHKRSIRAVSFHPTSNPPVLATGSFDSTAGIWRLPDSASTDWDFSVILDGHESEIKSLSFSSGGTFLATCSRDKSVWIWEELEEDVFETVAVLQDHTQDVKCVAWHPEELVLASSSYDESVRIWREVHGEWECVALLEQGEGTVWSLAWGKDGRLVAVGDDGVPRIWERVDGGAEGDDGEKVPSILRGDSGDEKWRVAEELPKVHVRSVYSVAWSARSGRIVTCGGDGRIVVYEQQEGKWKVAMEKEGAHGVHEVNCVVWCKRFDKDARSAEEEIVASCGDDGEVRIWTIEA